MQLPIVEEKKKKGYLFQTALDDSPILLITFSGVVANNH